MLQGFPISASASRTPVAIVAGAKTQLAGVVGAAAVGLLLWLALNLLRQLPMAALAAVVIASAGALVEVADLRRIYRIQRAQDAVAAAASPAVPVRWLVVGAEPVTSIDVTAADMLAELDLHLQAAGVLLCFAEMKDPVKDQLKRFELFLRWGESRFFSTVGEAVSRYLAAYPVA